MTKVLDVNLFSSDLNFQLRKSKTMVDVLKLWTLDASKKAKINSADSDQTASEEAV